MKLNADPSNQQKVFLEYLIQGIANIYYKVFVNASYEYLIDIKDLIENTLRMYNTQISLQAGFYF